jgi:hypothetical protein
VPLVLPPCTISPQLLTSGVGDRLPPAKSTEYTKTGGMNVLEVDRCLMGGPAASPADAILCEREHANQSSDATPPPLRATVRIRIIRDLE